MDEMNFEYKVSVIVPVYNAKSFLRGCLDSLWLQTIDYKQLEVLLINDGSTDSSGDICKEYTKNYSIFKYIEQDNAGPSAARNLGIKMAKGKYIMFLDADDELSENAIKLVTDFFDEHYDEIDMVSYYDQYYKGGKALPPHVRYNYLKNTGIYDLNKTPYCMTLRLSICVKNLQDDNLLFDESINYQEDQKYCTKILSSKMKLGFVKEAVYKYNKNETSIVGTSTNAITMFENSTKIFEDMFAENEIVPLYYQALFFHDLQWKFSSTCLYPYHYSPDQLKEAKGRIQSLLRKVNNEIIMNYTGIDNYQKLYWIRQKEDNKLTPVLTEANLSMVYNGNCLYRRKDVEVILKRIRVCKDGYIKIVGYFKSPFFSLCDDTNFFIERNDKLEKLDVNIASASFYKAKEKTDTFWAFSYEIKVKNYERIRFLCKIDNVMYNTVFWIGKMVPFNAESKRSEYAVNGCKVSISNNSILVFENIGDGGCTDYISKTILLLKDNTIKKYRQFYIENKNRRIWLYIDNYAVPYDNGWLQFISDIKREDGIERYYILTNETIRQYYDLDEYSNIISFGSDLHKMLLLCAEKLLTAFIEVEVCFPYTNEEKSSLNDLFNLEVVYLQHGVLHAHLPWYYTPTNLIVDKEVVSSRFEIDNLSHNYGFKPKDLIPTGMPRYDYIDRQKRPENKILFAPSWRSYLVGEIKSDGSIRDGNSSKLFASNYYKNIMQFIEDTRLHDILDKYNMELHLKFHPEFISTYGSDINLNMPRITFINSKVDVSEYKIFITDFSSFVFDFAYLNRPIMYFVPDYVEFCAGVNHYRELDLPFEKAFGRLAKDSDTAVDILEEICKNDCVPEKTYAERMEKFYLPMNHVTDSLYQYLISEDAK